MTEADGNEDYNPPRRLPAIDYGSPLESKTGIIASPRTDCSTRPRERDTSEEAWLTRAEKGYRMSRRNTRPEIHRIAWVSVLILAGFLSPGYAQEIDSDVYSELRYRHIGPQGNRVVAVVGVPGDPNIVYTGAASGGIWKSIDGGINWEPIFDNQEVSSIGSLAIAPSDPNIVWAGTGETFLRNNISIGNGIYKSTDTGKTWKHMGLEKTGRIGRIVIHPSDPDIVLAAAMGHCHGPQPERGIYRTTDGGETWDKVLFVDENTGGADIAMDPNNPRILFASMWQVLVTTWGVLSGGPGSSLHKSTDGGATWTPLRGHGLPATTLGKIAVAVAPSNSDRVYATIETGDGVPQEGKNIGNGSLWRSEDGGEEWKLISYDHSLNERTHYYGRMAVAPDNADDVYFIGGTLVRSIDGGVSAEGLRGGDNHDMWIDPTDPDRMILGADPGPVLTTNRGRTWSNRSLPIAQMYHVEVDNKIPYFVYGNRQDGPSFRGPSNPLGGGITAGLWRYVGGNESGWAVPDPVDDNIVWSGGYDGALDRFDLDTGHAQSVKVWPETSIGFSAGDMKYRFNWTFPIAISPHDHNRVYVGSQYVHQTTDGGRNWKVISPDLSTDDETLLENSDGSKSPSVGVEFEFGSVVFAIAESPLEEGLIWAGTNDGNVQVTRDGGANWTNVTGNIPGLPAWGTVSNIEPSRYDVGSSYITVNLHHVNNRDPHVYKTTDYGKSWKSISSDIPRSVFSYARCVREDPVRKGLLYLGTENALYVSFNDGDNWVPLQNNMPHTPVHWMVVQEHFNDLVVGTYGRGFWIMDDITPLQQLTSEVVDSEVHLFAARPAYRFRNVGRRMSVYNAQTIGQGPPYGASINYYLKSAPTDDVTITILDEKDQTIKTLEGSKEPGINRVMWDLRHEPSRSAMLRTNHDYGPHVELDSRTQTRPLPAGGSISPQAVPGIYTVKLSVEGQELSQKLTVKKDPNSAGSEADIQAQVKMSLELREDVNSIMDMIDKIETIRGQIYDLTILLEEDENAGEVISAAEELDNKLKAVEEGLFQMKQTPGADFWRWKTRLLGRFLVLASEVGSSWGGAGNDFAPTTAQVEVHELLKKRLTTHQDRLNELLDKDVPAFTDLLREKNLPTIFLQAT